MHLVYVHHFQIGKLERGSRIIFEMNWNLSEKEIVKELLMFNYQRKGWVVHGYQRMIKINHGVRRHILES